MSSLYFRDSFIAPDCRGAIAKAKLLAPLKHKGLQGQLREVLMRDMLNPVLPPEIRQGTGKLVSYLGDESPQLDVILYAPSILPPWLLDENTGFFPAKSCLYSIEVKSRLTAEELRKAISSARKTRSMPLVGETVVPITALFAFESNKKGDPEKEITRYRTHDSKADTDPAIQVICIVGRGYWFFNSGIWKYAKASTELNEVMAFLGGTTNTVPKVLAAKGRPNFGNYISNDIPFKTV